MQRDVAGSGIRILSPWIIAILGNTNSTKCWLCSKDGE
jgi:hypothetical protein